MTATAYPKIAHGIVRLHPESEFPNHLWRRGPAWALPPARTGEWYIHLIFDAAVRVEFDEALPTLSRYAVHLALDSAREALSAEEEARRNDWLGWADKREAAAFVRTWNIRKRREYGGIPTVAAGAYIRASKYSGVWHIASGLNGASWDPDDRQTVGTECPEQLSIDLGADEPPSVIQTTEPDRVCKRCAGRVAGRQHAVAETTERVTVPA